MDAKKHFTFGIRNMIRNFTIALALLASVCSVSADDFRYPERSINGASLRYVDKIPVLTLSGSPEEMGTQQTALAVDPAKDAYTFPRRFLKRMGVGDAGWFLVKSASRTVLQNGSKRHRAELNQILAKTLVDKDSVSVANAFLEIRRLGGCSALIVEDDRTAIDGPMFGRNFDFPSLGLLQKFSLITAYRLKDRHSFVSIGFPGLVGVISGMNDKGLAIATLDVYQSKDGSAKFNPKGVPLTWTYRRILEECETVEQTFALLKKTERTTWMNLAVCDKQHGAVFELTPENVVMRIPTASIISCTNHFRTPELAVLKGGRRFKALEASRDVPKIGLKEMSRRLHATQQSGWTIQTMIFEPKAGRIHVALGDGPTSNKPLTTLDVGQLLRQPKESE